MGWIMKKIVFVNLLLLLGVVLSSCTRSYDFDSENLRNEITKIEIIKLYDYQGDLYPDNEKEIEVLMILTEDLKNQFIDDFSLLTFEKYYGTPNNSPKGKCLKFYYDDGTYAYITYYTYLRFSEDGSNFVSTQNIHTSEKDFLDLIDNYIDMI